jgi:hypothetical protein
MQSGVIRIHQFLENAGTRTRQIAPAGNSAAGTALRSTLEPSIV